MANKDFMDPELTEEEKKEMILENEDDYLEGDAGCSRRCGGRYPED